MDRHYEKPEEDEIVVHVDIDLEDLIPGYIGNRNKDIDEIHAALERGDFEAIRVLGHGMKGSGGGYGFDRITEIGKIIEQASKEGGVEEIKNQLDNLSHYLASIRIIYDK